MLASPLGTRPGTPRKHTAGPLGRKSDLAPWRTPPSFPGQLPREATPHVQKHSPACARPALAGPPVLGHTPLGRTLLLPSLPSHLHASLKASAFCQTSIPNLLSRPGENVSEIFPESHCQEPRVSVPPPPIWMPADFSLGSQAPASSLSNPFSTPHPQSLLKHRDLGCSKPLVSSVRVGLGWGISTSVRIY